MSVILEKMIKHGDKDFKVNIERYESSMEVARDCDKRMITDSSFYDMRNESLRSWHGVRNYEEALELLHNGYEPQATMMDLNKISGGISKRITFENNIMGFAPIVPLALKNVPNCMINTNIRPIKAKVIDLYYETTHSSNISAEDIIKDGEKILGAIISLEKKGYRINLYAMQSYTNYDGSDLLLIKIKSSNQPFDLKRMSYPLMHPAFFRVIGFDWYSKFPKGKYRSGYGHWFGSEFCDKTPEKIKQLFGDTAVYIAGMDIYHEKQEYIENKLTNVDTVQ